MHVVCRLGCVRKTFSRPNFSLVRVIIHFGAKMPQKNFEPVGQYFLLRKCTGSSDPPSCYMKKKKNLSTDLCDTPIFYQKLDLNNIAARGSELPAHFRKRKYWPTGSKFLWGILAPKRMITLTRLKLGLKKVFLTHPNAGAGRNIQGSNY